MDGFYAFVLKRDGKFYAAFALMNDDCCLAVKIFGPFANEDEAQQTSDEWSNKNSKRGVAKSVLDFPGDVLAADVRAGIVDCITGVIEQGHASDDIVYGKAFPWDYGRG